MAATCTCAGPFRSRVLAYWSQSRAPKAVQALPHNPAQPLSPMSLSAPRLDGPARVGSQPRQPFVPARPSAPRRAVSASAEPQKGKKRADTPNPMTAYRCVSVWPLQRRQTKDPHCLRRRRHQPATVIVSRLLPPSCCRPLSPHFLLCFRAPSKEGASLRAEAEAPFRGFRLFIFGAGAVGAGLATLFGLPSLIGALGGAPGATKTIAEALQDFGINVGSFAVLAFLVQRDLQVGGHLA